MANRIPLNIVNRIIMSASQLNDNTFVPQFKESGKISRHTKRLCVCCKKSTTMYFVVNTHKFKDLLQVVNRDISFQKKIDVPLFIYYNGYDNDNLLNGYKITFKAKYYLSENILKIQQKHIIKTIEENNITYILLTTLSSNQNDTMMIFKNESGYITTIGDQYEPIKYHSIEGVNIEDGIMRIYPYEYEANWVWNNELQIMEFIVPVN